MKRNLTHAFLAFVLVLAFHPKAFAQISFTFTAVAGTFTANSGATTLHAAGIDDALSAATNIGFSFTYNCVTYTQFKASSNGWLSLGSAATANMFGNALATTGQGPIVAPLWDDLLVGTGGSVNYVMTGSAPNRVLTVEWLNMEWSYTAASAGISCQVKLYETTNVIEYIYRQDAGATASPSASIGLNGGTSGTDFYSLNGTGGSPAANYGTETNNLSAKPATGQVYRWTPAGAMTFTSCTATQPNTANVIRCDADQDIIAVQVVTAGGCGSPMSVTQFQVNMTGSTIPGTNTNDVTQIHIYYTGTSATFAASNEFFSGGTTPAAGTMTINGSQSLSAGTNYFWIAYDMNGVTGTAGNVVDAQCTQLTVGGLPRTPTTTAPAGSRTIAVCSTAPGAVGTNIAFWIKANAGTSTTTNAAALATWNDQSGNARNAAAPAAANRPTYYDNATDNINFNPVIDFDDASQSAANGDYMDIASNGILPSGSNQYAVYAVIKPGPNNLSTPGKFLFSGAAGPNNFCSFDVRSGNSFNDSWNLNDVIAGSTWTSGYPALAAFNFNSTQRDMYISGTSVGSVASGGRTSTNTNSALGCQRSASPVLELYDGNIAEIVTYTSTSHSQSSRNKVETYLAIKYGVTLSHNYVSSTGTTVWSTTTNASYNNNIIGIARDDNSVLSQKQSKSTSTTADMLTIYIGPTKQTNQSANTGTFTAGNLSFFLSGSNSAAAINTTWPHPEIPPGICCKLQREWLAQMSNFTNTDLKLEFDFTSLSGYGPLVATDLRLLVDADGNFTNATILASPAISVSVVGTVVTVTVAASNFTTTPYFTLASVQTSSPLPVGLVSFAGTCENEKPVLRWTTATETSNEAFFIERTTDGMNFQSLARIDGAGNSSQPVHYTWTDENPLAAPAVYRLLQKDYNHAPEVISMITTENCLDDEQHVEIYPNPFTGSTVCTVVTAADTYLTINIYDATGRRILVPAGNQYIEKGSSRLSIAFDGLAPGIYFAHVQLGGKTYHYRLIQY
ncbi:MAG: fibronectin type III domain-containing protein [Bacteroidetes bacterium]|nr:MAG: fibronectin type III domain-containing protein [Bacteroidota bacterium]